MLLLTTHYGEQMDELLLTLHASNEHSNISEILLGHVADDFIVHVLRASASHACGTREEAGQYWTRGVLGAATLARGVIVAAVALHRLRNSLRQLVGLMAIVKT